jgi:hypothetical protein
MKTSLCCVVSLVIFCNNLQGETLWNRALGSQAALKSYCLEQSRYASISVGGGDNFVAISNAAQYVTISNSNPLILLKLVSEQKIGFGVLAGSTQNVFKSCQFFDSQHRVTFSGTAKGEIINNKRSSSIKWSDLDLKVTDALNLDLSQDYSSAHVYLSYLTTNGNQLVYLGGESKFVFPTAFAGLRGAKLLIRGHALDGSVAQEIIDLGNGEIMPVREYYSTSHKIRIEGISYHEGAVVNTVKSTGAIGDCPLIQLIVKNQCSTFRVKTTEGEYPCGFYYRQISEDGCSEWKYQTLSTKQRKEDTFTLLEGVYHLDFVWNSFCSERWRDFQWWGMRE